MIGQNIADEQNHVKPFVARTRSALGGLYFQSRGVLANQRTRLRRGGAPMIESAVAPDQDANSAEDAGSRSVDVGSILHRVRQQRGISLDDLATASGVSASFLSTVERGTSNNSVSRPARVANVFGLDLPTFLGYFSSAGKPRILTVADRIPVDRGPRSGLFPPSGAGRGTGCGLDQVCAPRGVSRFHGPLGARHRRCGQR